MIDPASVADWMQASFMTGLVAGLAAAGMWALKQEQHESSVAPSRNIQAVGNDHDRLRAAVEEHVDWLPCRDAVGLPVASRDAKAG
jgi:hypothetical protein